MSMRFIVVRKHDGSIVQHAANSAGEGLFFRKQGDAEYHQITGTCQTPVFQTYRRFRRYIGRIGGRVIGWYGWTDRPNNL